MRIPTLSLTLILAACQATPGNGRANDDGYIHPVYVQARAADGTCLFVTHPQNAHRILTCNSVVLPTVVAQFNEASEEDVRLDGCGGEPKFSIIMHELPRFRRDTLFHMYDDVLIRTGEDSARCVWAPIAARVMATEKL